jgi:DNA-directed RNA polymerase specialized sigma24 family protein
MQDDAEDLRMFRESPFDLLLKYQPVFELIARRYACNGYYPFGHSDEIVQHVNERVFSRIEKIREQFDGRVLVRTYLSAICRKIILEYIRCSGRRDELLAEYMAEVSEPYVGYSLDYVIVEEFRRLDRVMLLFGSKRYKLWLLMKLLYRIRVEPSDFNAVNPNAAALISRDLLTRFNEDADLKDREIFQLVFPFFLRFEVRLTHYDSLRKWYRLKVSDVVSLMNGKPARAAYSQDTLQILVEKYCDTVATGGYVPITGISSECVEYPQPGKLRKLLRKAR